MSLEANGEFAALAARHPANARFKRDEWLTLHNAGDAGMRLGSAWDDLGRLLAGEEAAQAARQSELTRADALALFERALAMAESLFNSDEANLEGERDLAVMLNKVGTILIVKRAHERVAIVRQVNVRDTL